MTYLQVGELLVKFKIWFQQVFTGKKSRAKIPRKKVQIQFLHAKEQFSQQLSQLQQVINRQDIFPSTHQLGELLLNDVKRFESLHLIEINENRLNQITDPLIHPVDFSLWVLYQMYSYTEEIYHYMKTVEVVQL